MYNRNNLREAAWKSAYILSASSEVCFYSCPAATNQRENFQLQRRDVVEGGYYKRKISTGYNSEKTCNQTEQIAQEKIYSVAEIQENGGKTGNSEICYRPSAKPRNLRTIPMTKILDCELNLYFIILKV